MTQITNLILRPKNPSIEDNPRSYLTAAVSAAGTDLPVLSTAGFVITGANDYYVIVGEYGNEATEIVLVDASDAGSDNTGLTVGALKYAHSAGTPVTYIEWNQVRLYGGLTGAVTNLVSTYDIDCSKQFTEFVNDQVTYSVFVTRYYNVDSTYESQNSSEITSSSYARTSVKKIIESGLRKGMTYIDQGQDSILSWDIAKDVCQAGIDETLARKRNWHFLHKIDENTSTVASTAYVAFPSDISLIDKVIVDDIELDWMSTLTYNSYTEAGAAVSTGQPSNYTIKNNKVYLYPTPAAVYTVQYEYWYYPTLSTLETTLPQPFVVPIMYYCASEFAYIRGNDKRGDKMFALFQNALERQAEEYSGPVQRGQAEYVERTNEFDTEYNIENWGR